MPPAAPPPSSRLLRAADAERSELERHRGRLLATRDQLRAELARIESGLAEVDERRRLLDRLAPREPQKTHGHAHEARAPSDGHRGAHLPPPGRPAATLPAAEVLQGPAVRETAVRLLLARGNGIEAMHYRDWFEMVTAEGFAIAGKDPLAVFLTQLNRSPVVRRSTQAGVYALDHGAPARLRSELDELHGRLRALPTTPPGAQDLAEARARRRALTAQIGQVEKALEEASRLLAAAPPSPVARAN